MQSDPLSPLPEENQPGSLSAPDEQKPLQSPVREVNAQKRGPITGILVIFLVILLVAVAGLGFWAYQLNSNLVATQQQLTTLQNDYADLQSEHATLKSDHEKLTTDLSQANTDLEKSNGDLTTAQADLQKSQDQNKGLNTRVDLASKKAEVLYAIANVSNAAEFLAIDALVKSTRDDQLLAQWNNFVAAPSAEGSGNLILYLIGSIRDSLK